MSRYTNVRWTGIMSIYDLSGRVAARATYTMTRNKIVNDDKTDSEVKKLAPSPEWMKQTVNMLSFSKIKDQLLDQSAQGLKLVDLDILSPLGEKFIVKKVTFGQQRFDMKDENGNKTYCRAYYPQGSNSSYTQELSYQDFYTHWVQIRAYYEVNDHIIGSLQKTYESERYLKMLKPLVGMA